MLAREFRIAADKEIKRTLKLGKRFNAPECSLYLQPNTFSHPRIAVIVASGVAKTAVLRNRLKRQCRDVLRVAIQQGVISHPFDIAVIIRSPATRIPDRERRAFFRSFFERARLIRPGTDV